MSTFLWNCFVKAWLALFSLRYRIKVKGLELLTEERLNRKGGILFLPNHSALIDPVFLFLILWPRFRMHPLVVESMYRVPLFRFWMKVLGAVPLPDFDRSINPFKIKRAELSFEKIIQWLNQKENVVFYPSGRLKKSGKEILGGVSGLHSLLERCPDANVVMIRTTGLWGSSFSQAIEGCSPDPMKTPWAGIKMTLKNFLFLNPRRQVLIEMEPNPKLPKGSKIELNQALEQWYNRYPDEKGETISDIEPLRLVSSSCWQNKIPSPHQKEEEKREREKNISPETRKKIYGEIRRILNREELEIRDDMSLATDLAMDSLNTAELMGFVAKHFDVDKLYPGDFDTVENAMRIASGGASSESLEDLTSHFTWPEEKEERCDPFPPQGKTLAEAFLLNCHRMGSSVACGDDLLGPLTYQKFKKGVLVLAERFRKIEGQNVGVLLPASIGAYLVILALFLAKKVPVMLNWTLGPRYVDEMVEISGVKEIISSWRFLDRAAHIDVGEKGFDKIVFLEDIRLGLTLKEKLRGVWLSRCSVPHILRSLGLDQIDPDDPAVILFTSGTEASPKGVPLSHTNILSNQISTIEQVELRTSDAIYGILPPFHSFGFSIAGLLPFFVGIKAAFFPDPTDSFALAEGIERWKITLLCTAPSFLRSLLRDAKPGQLDSMRIFVSGAEKASPELFEKVGSLKGKPVLYEGYGITECSPVIAINTTLSHESVGRPLPHIEICTIHPETLQLLPRGKEGELCIIGPNVFHGYLNNVRSPFIELEGRHWYRTGDIGFLDSEGNLVISGRLKRFVKIGGEMISLSAVEETLLKALQGRNGAPFDAPCLALCVDGRQEGKPRLIAFTTIELSVEEANEFLHQRGFSPLIKISQVRRIEEIPLMGAGKIDYRTLQSTIVYAQSDSKIG